MKHVKMQRIVEISGALECFTEAKGNGPQLVKGGIGYLPLAFRVATAQQLLKPLMEAYNETRKPLVEECQLPAELDEKIPNGAMKLDFKKLGELSKPLLDEEVDMPDLKPLTWQLLEKAKVEVDPAVIIMLGDFLQGEPSEEAKEAKAPA